MKVYLLYLGEYSDRYCVGVYSTLEKAQAAAARELGRSFQSPPLLQWETWPDRQGQWMTTGPGPGCDIEEHEVQ